MHQILIEIIKLKRNQKNVLNSENSLKVNVHQLGMYFISVVLGNRLIIQLMFFIGLNISIERGHMNYSKLEWKKDLIL